MNNPPRHRPLPLDHLRCFEAVARLLNFSAAAEEVHLTQPAVSRRIQSLEEELGAPLFQRGTRKVELTQAGRELLRAVEPSLSRIDGAVRRIRLNRSRSMVSVTTFASFASLWLMPRLPIFEQAQPDTDLRISASDRLVDQDDEELDFALRAVRPGFEPPGSVRLFGEVITPVIGLRLAEAVARGDAPPLEHPADLAHHTLLEMDDHTPGAIDQGWAVWLTHQGVEGLTPHRRISMNYSHQQVQAALSGQGVAAARLPLVHDLLERGELIEPFGAAGRRGSPWCYWLVPLAGSTGSTRPETQAFTHWVLEQAAITRQAIGDEPDVHAHVQASH